MFRSINKIKQTSISHRNFYLLGMAEIVLGEQGKLDEAMERYQKALKINPDLFQVHNSLAILLAQWGDFR